MNITKRPVYQKGQPRTRSKAKVKRKSKNGARPANAEERRHWARVRPLGCLVCNSECKGRTTIHHCGTGGGGRKNHMLVIPLCVYHHTGAGGINGGIISRRAWEEKHGTETYFLKLLERKLKHV